MAGTSQGPRYVIVMGPIGSGKNHFIWMASGQGGDRIRHNLAEGSADISADTTPIEYTHPSQHSPVIFVDTTGFEKLEKDRLYSLFGWLNKDIEDKNGELAGIILLHQIAPNQISAASIHHQLQTLEDMCGVDVMKNVVVATTMWDTVPPENIAGPQGRHAKLQTALFDGTIKRGCKLEEYRGSKDSAWKSINYLLNQKPYTPILVQQGPVVQPVTDQATKVGCWKSLFSCC